MTAQKKKLKGDLAELHDQLENGDAVVSSLNKKVKALDAELEEVRDQLEEEQHELE